VTQSILVIKGDTKHILALRKQVIATDVLFPTANLIYHENQPNHHVPDLVQGWDAFDSLIQIALHGPRITEYRANLEASATERVGETEEGEQQ
jgi:hypothetical protein